MTREKFIDSAVREAERKLGVPAGWWGTYRDVRGPGGRRVYFGNGWAVSIRGKVISRHDSRAGAIAKARRS